MRVLSYPPSVQVPNPPPVRGGPPRSEAVPKAHIRWFWASHKPYRPGVQNTGGR